MFRVVPVHEVSEPRPGVLKGSECLRVSHRVLQGLVPELDEGVVIATAWAGVTADDQEGVKENSKRDPTHGVAVVRMDDLRAIGFRGSIIRKTLDEAAGA